MLYLKGVKQIHLLPLVQFLYNGQTTIPQDLVNELLDVAKDLSIKGLEEEVHDTLESNNEKHSLTNSLEPEKNAHANLRSKENDHVNDEIYFEPELVLQATKSIVWNFFKFAGSRDSGPKRNSVVCQLCFNQWRNDGRKKNIEYSGGTKNLLDHLNKHHCYDDQWIKAKEKEEGDKVHESFLKENQRIEKNVHANPGGAENDTLNDDGSGTNETYFEPELVLQFNPKSIVWKFFKFAGSRFSGPEKNSVVCQLCFKLNGRKKKVPYCGGSTSNLKEHLNYHHWYNDQWIKAKEKEEGDKVYESFVKRNLKPEKEIYSDSKGEENDPLNDEGSGINEIYFEPELVLNKVPKSIIWKFFKFPGSRDSGPRRNCVVCQLCFNEWKGRKRTIGYSGGTTNLVDHLNNHHRNDDQWNKAKALRKEGKFEASGTVTKEPSSLETRLSKCKFCDFEGRNEDILKRHCDITHKSPVTEAQPTISYVREEEDSEDNLKCDLCNFIGKNQDSLNRHKTIVHPVDEDDNSDSIEYMIKTETATLHEQLEEEEEQEIDNLPASPSQDKDILDSTSGEKKFGPEVIVKGLKPETLCWKFFHFKEQRNEDGSGQGIPQREKVYCNFCGKCLVYIGTTSDLNRHAKTMHRNQWEAFKAEQALKDRDITYKLM